MSDEKAVQVVEGGGSFRSDLMTVKNVEAMMGQVMSLMQSCMKADKHYGIIPGTSRKDKDGKELAKPTLLKPGAELLGVTFRLRPEYEHKPIWAEGGQLTIISKCRLYHIPTGTLVAEGNAICSTMESKYAYRNAGRKCPTCGKEAIFKSKEQYGGGYYCNKKSGGCGASWKKDDAKIKEIESQPAGKVPNEDPADQYNTIIKMGDKRSYVAAMLTATAASEVFTQDMEDHEENQRYGNPTTATETDMTDEVAGLIKNIKKLQDKQTKKVHYQIVTDSGVMVVTFDEATALKAKELMTKQQAVTIIYQKKSLQLLTMAATNWSGAEDDAAGTAQEPVNTAEEVAQ